MPNSKKDDDAQARADEVISNANRDYRNKSADADAHKPMENEATGRERAAADARSQMVRLDRTTGIIGPNDFDGTPPEDIAKMAIHRPVGNLPLGPGQVTGGAGIQGGKANVAPHQPAGGDRTPGQSGNPSAEDQDRAARSRVV